jgi:phosphate starvation-inducible membrane PsiE
VNIKWADKLRKGLHGSADSLGNLCVEAFHYLALFGIGAITAYAAVVTFLDMLGKGGVSVDDILLLFIYLELGAMVGIYFKTNHMPIRFLLYVAITALTRLLIGDVSHHKAPDVGLLYVWRHPAAGVLDPGGALRLLPLPVDQGAGRQRQGSGRGQVALSWQRRRPGGDDRGSVRPALAAGSGQARWPGPGGCCR